MPNRSDNTEILFLISDVARLLRTYSDRYAKGMGLTRAQWAVLLQLQRNEGLIQTDLAGVLDLKPITLTRLIDRLCKNKLVERRPDPNDRRAKFLFLTPAARALLDRIVSTNQQLAGTVFAGIEPGALDTLADGLGNARNNLRRAIERRA